MSLFKNKRKKFGEILVEKGLVSKNDVEEALGMQKALEAKHVQKYIGAILIEKGVIGDDDIKWVLEEQKLSEGFFLKSLIYSMFHSR